MCYIFPILSRQPAAALRIPAEAAAAGLLINRCIIWNHTCRSDMPKFGYNVPETALRWSPLLMPARPLSICPTALVRVCPPLNVFVSDSDRWNQLLVDHPTGRFHVGWYA